MKSPNLEDQTKRIRRFLGIADDELIELTNFYGKRIKVGMTTTEQGHTTLLSMGNDGNDFSGSYMLVNRVAPEVAARYRHGLWTYADNRVSDKEIIARRAIYIDIDAKRIKGLSSTQKELEAAREVVTQLRAYLAGKLGSECIGYGCSGNGYFILIAIEDAPPESTTETYGRFLELLNRKFGTDKAEIDRTVKNPARLMPCPGTKKCKGQSTDDRPHREVSFSCPSAITRLSIRALEPLIAELEKELGPVAHAPKKEKPAPPKPTPEIREFASSETDPRLRHAINYISKMPAAIAGEGGHNATYRVAATLAGKFKLAEAEIFEVLRDHYNDRCQPPWSEAELQHKAEDAFRKREIVEDERTPIVVAGVDEIFAPLPPIPWIVEGLEIAPGAPIILGGQGYTGKSLIAQAMLVSVPSGKSVWNFYPCSQGAVIHLDYEQGRDVTFRRYQRLAAGMGVSAPDIAGKLEVVTRPRFYLDDHRSRAELRALLQGKRLCLIDSFRAAFPTVNEDDSGTRRFLDPISDISEQTGCAVMLLAHSRKGRATGGNLSNIRNSLRGSSALFDAGGTVMMLQCDPATDARQLHLIKARILGTKSEPISLSIEDGPNGDKGQLIVSAKISGLQKQLREDLKLKLRERIIDVLKRESNVESLRYLHKAVDLTRSKKNTEDMKSVLTDLLSEGLVVQAGTHYIWVQNYQ